MGTEQSSVQKPETKYRKNEKFEEVGKHPKDGIVILETSFQTKKQKKKTKKVTWTLPDLEAENPYESVIYGSISSLTGDEDAQDAEQTDRLDAMSKKLDECVKNIKILQAAIQGGRQPGSDLPRLQTQHEVEVYSYRHAEDSSAEGVDTGGNEGDTNDEGAYADYDGRSIFYVNAAEYRDSSRVTMRREMEKW